MPDLLLVGAGHAHLHLIAHANELRTSGYRVQVLAPRWFDYSGVASATATGVLPPDAGRIDVRALAATHGVELVESTLVGLDLVRRFATTAAGTRLEYDVVSLNIGSVADASAFHVNDAVLRVKPLSGLTTLSTRLAEKPGATVTVIGGGPTGLELAAHLAVRDGVAKVRLVEAGPEIGAALPPRARRRLTRLLTDRDVEILTGTAVREVTAGDVRISGSDSGSGSGVGWDRTLLHDVALLATGLVAPPLVSELGLGDADGVPVTATLQHIDHPDTYAAGDCAHFTPQPLPRVGVHGVRQGPVLLASLLARARGEALPTYEPQAQALAVLDLGGGVGLAVRGRWWWYGAAALRLKRWIDRRWLSTYR